MPLSFDATVGAMNIYTGRDRTETFGRLIVGEAKKIGGGAKILDVGCGSGLGVNDQSGMTSLRDIRSNVLEFWGCEPDAGVMPNSLLDRFERGTLQAATLPESYFDIVYAHYVVEHVADPLAFLKKANLVLRPGGKFIFMTPNARHYFVKIARLVAVTGLEAPILRVLHPNAAAAHYPTKYLLNDEGLIEKLALKSGFSRCEFAYFDHGDLRGYFPRPFGWIPIALERILIALRKPQRLPGLVVRLTK